MFLSHGARDIFLYKMQGMLFVVCAAYLPCLVSSIFILYKNTMKKNLFTVAFGATIVAGALMLTSVNVGKASAGTTTLTGTSCDGTVTATEYDIDYGTFSPTDVLTAIKYNAGTKGGTSATPSNGSAGVYIIASNTCQSDVSWSVRAQASPMTSMISGNPTIASGAQTFSGATTVYLFSGSASNNTITAADFSATTDLSTWRTILTKSSTNNGLA